MVSKASGRRGDAIDLTLDSPSPPLFSSHDSFNAVAGPSRVKTPASGRRRLSSTSHRSQRKTKRNGVRVGDSTPEVRSETAKSATSRSSGFGSAPNITDDEPFASIFDLLDARSLSSRESKDPGPSKPLRGWPKSASKTPGKAFANALQLSSVRHSVSPRQPKKIKPEPKSPYAPKTDERRMGMLQSRSSRAGPFRASTGTGSQQQPFEIISSGESTTSGVPPLSSRKGSSGRSTVDIPPRRPKTPALTASPAKRLKASGAFGSHGKPKDASPFGPRLGRSLAKTASREWRDFTPTPITTSGESVIKASPSRVHSTLHPTHISRPADSSTPPSKYQKIQNAAQIVERPTAVPPKETPQHASGPSSPSQPRPAGSLDAPRSGAPPLNIASEATSAHSPAVRPPKAIKELHSNLTHAIKRKRLDDDSDGSYRPKSSQRSQHPGDILHRSTRPKPAPGAYTLPDPTKPEQWSNHSSRGSFKNLRRKVPESTASASRQPPASVPPASSELSSSSGGPMTLTLPAATQRTPDSLESRESSPLTSLSSVASQTTLLSPRSPVVASLEATDVGSGDAAACSLEEAKPDLATDEAREEVEEPVEPIEEQEVDLLDMYADFEFTARSPTASQASAHIPPFTPTKTSFSTMIGVSRSGRGPQALLSPSQAKIMRGQTPHTPSNVYRKDMLATPSRSKRAASQSIVTPSKSAQRPGSLLPTPVPAARSSKASKLVEQLLMNGEQQRKEQLAAFEREMQERQKRMEAVLLGANEPDDTNEDFFLQKPLVKHEMKETLAEDNEDDRGSRRSERIRSASHPVRPASAPAPIQARRSPSGIDLLIRERRSEVKRGTSGVGAGAALAVIRGETVSPKKEALRGMPYPTPESGVRSGSDGSDEPEEELELDADRLREALPDDMQVDTKLLRVADSRAHSMSRRASVMRGWEGFWGFKPPHYVKEEPKDLGIAAGVSSSPTRAVVTDLLDTAESVSSLIVSGVVQDDGSTLKILYERLLKDVFTIDNNLERTAMIEAVASLPRPTPAESGVSLMTTLILDIFKKRGAKLEYLPVSTEMSVLQAVPCPADRYAASLTLCQLLAAVRLPAREAECLVLPLVILGVDHETGPELYKGVQAALGTLFCLCDSSQDGLRFAAKLVDGFASLPLELRGDILAVIGQSSAFTREVCRWIAIDSLVPGCLAKLLADDAMPPSVPPLYLLEKATKRILMTVLSGDVDWEDVAARFSYLAEAMTDLDALVAQHPLNMEQSREEAVRLHPVQRLRVTVNGIHGKIRELSSVSVAPIKARISQMGLALRLRIEDAVYRQRRAAPKRLGSNLQVGEGGGQTKLNFAAASAAREDRGTHE